MYVFKIFYLTKQKNHITRADIKYLGMLALRQVEKPEVDGYKNKDDFNSFFSIVMNLLFDS